MDYKIRLLEKKDCEKAARLRITAQEWGFLPAMGLQFQIEILKGTSESKWGFGIVCIEENEKIIGMVYAATNLQKFYKSIFLRRGAKLSLIAILKLVQNPKLLIGIIQYFIYPQKVPFKHIKAEWLSMVVDSEYREKGIGKKLTLALIDEYNKRKITQFKSTVSNKNTITCGLHEKIGFEFLGNFSLCDEQIRIYKYTF